MKNIFTKVSLVILMTMSSCKDMKLDIQDSKDRLDVLEGTTITTINEQITAINSSIADLQDMDETLDGYIKTLETTAADLQKQINDANAEIKKVESELGEEITALEQSLLKELNSTKEAIQAELTTINKTLDDLMAADADLDKKIADLQTYVDTELASTKDWANATFSTLTQYAETQMEISAIKASIEQTNQSLANLESSMTEKMATDLKTAIDALRAELSADYIAKIENAVNKVTEAYTSVISSVIEELTTAYTTAISTAIAESEAGMKAWVNEQLTQGYYDIATLDGILSALSTRLDETDDDLQRQITEQQSALQTAMTELTDANKTAINAAISDNNGIINAAIAEAVQNLDDKIQARLTVIDTHISNIQKQLTNISKDIASIFEQIAGISSSISDLQDVDKELDGIIDALETELASLKEEFESLKPVDEPTKDALEKDITDIKALIYALQAKDTELASQITSLQTYIDTELQKTTDWAEATFATLEQYSTVQTEIAAIKTLINKTKEEITEEYTVAIETAISNCETDMKVWVNTQLAQGYYNIAAIDGKVSALETLISDSDSDLQNQINGQKAALQQAKTDLTKEYKQYIGQAIAAGGIIDQAISAQVKTAQDNLQAQIDVINGRLDALEDRVGKLEEDFVNRIQSLKYIPEYSDGKVKMSDVFKTISLDLLVSPPSQAKAVQLAWGTNESVVSAYMRCTKSPETKAISPAVPLIVTSVIGDNDGTLKVIVKEDKDNPIDADFFDGSSNAVAYIKISDGNNDIFSDLIEIESCIELSVYEDLSPLVNGVYQTANCYIVSKAGAYKFKAYKGNSNELAGVLDSDSLPKGKIDHAKVLWETFGTDVVPNVGDLISYTDYQNGYVVFNTADSFKEGNAVIAVRDDSGNILWSWHIWFTDEPQGHIYKNNAGTMMDRNLGATSATPGDVGALGLLYQWGRKDSFLNSSSISKAIEAKSTITWPSSVSTSSSRGTVSYVTANPTTYVCASSSPYDWHYAFRDNSLWTTSDKTKSIYDPCPAGWRIPDGGSNGVWSTAGFGNTSYNSGAEGILFIISTPSTTWYPASGQRGTFSGSLEYVGSSGHYWSASPYNDPAYYLNLSEGGYVYPSSSYHRAYGQSVRCLQESK